MKSKVIGGSGTLALNHRRAQVAAMMMTFSMFRIMLNYSFLNHPAADRFMHLSSPLDHVSYPPQSSFLSL
jgi:hypothetical protein